MDYRKLIKFGENSFVISLPKLWLSKNRLVKGNVVYLTENGNNELMVSPQEQEHAYTAREIILELDNEPDFESIKRKIFSKYIAGYDLFTLRGEKTIKEHGEKLREMLSQLLAFEIIEESKNKLVMKDYIDSRAISVENTIRRVDILLRSMLDDLKSVYREDMENLARRDREINKLTLLALRIINKAIIHPSLQQKIGLRSDVLLRTWDLFTALEHFADEVKRVARYLGASKADKQNIEETLRIFHLIAEDYKNIMKAWYTKDEKIAYVVANNVPPILHRCDALLKKQKDIPLSHALVKLKTMETFIKKIARAVYDG